MIIGVSGKIGSGKDLIGQIIQYLTKKDSDMDDQYFIEELAGDEFFGDAVSDWQIRKFADKLEDIVCLLIGCTREQLEDREFKEKELGEEWNRLVLYNNGIRMEKHKSMTGLFSEIVESLTPRLLLQLLGTECGREIIHPNIWINALFADYKALYDAPIYSGDKIIDQGLIYPNWIITDVRFPNESEAIKKRNGILIRVNRNSNEVSNHESEIALDDYAGFDYIIENNGTIEELIEKVRQILQREKVIF